MLDAIIVGILMIFYYIGEILYTFEDKKYKKKAKQFMFKEVKRERKKK